MRAAILAAIILSGIASPGLAAETCMPTEEEQVQVMETMTAVQAPDFAALGAGRPELAGCGLWSLQISAQGGVTGLASVRLEGDDAFRQAVERWLRTLRFEPRTQAWRGLVPVTMENGGKQ